MLPFKDISYAQGVYNMAANTDPIIMIRMSHGDGTLAFDSQAARNYSNAKAHGKAVGGYHFSGGGDPIIEADFFLRAMSPLAEGDVLCLDWEIEHHDPVGWCNTFLTHIHNATGVWPLIYLNIDRLNRFDWNPVLNNCGLWLAAPSYGFNETIPNVHHTYIAQQGPIVNGVDTDMFFGTLEEFKKYGYVNKVIDIQPPPVVQPPKPTPPLPPPPLPGEVVPPTSTPSTPPAPPVVTTTTTTTAVASTPVGTVVSVSKSKFSALAPYNKFVVGIVGMVMTYLIQTYTGQPWLEHLVMVLTVLGIYQIKNEPVV